MRLFVAVDLPAFLRQEIGRRQAKLRRELPPARWVRPEGIHATLKFLGEQGDDLPGRLGSILAGPAASLAPVEVVPEGAGFFPDPRRPRVGWLGARADGLAAWAAAVEDAAAAVGIARERRPFSLHLTLVRLERPWPDAAVRRFLDDVSSWRLEPFTAVEMTLFRSELGPGGATYTGLGRWRVGEGDRDAS